jgi:hypothetical protein
MKERIESHSCENLMLVCMDFRFQQDISNWAEEQGLSGTFDLISLAGAQKAIVDEDTRPTFMKQLKTSVELHHAKRVIMIAHQDCGAYGGSKKFTGWEAERLVYLSELENAKKIVLDSYPQLVVQKMLLVFDDEGKVTISEV